jgi:hypothetical protein
MQNFTHRVVRRPYGPPHKIVMNLTVMVKYNAIEQTTPVRETFRLGSLESIAEEPRLSASPTSYHDQPFSTSMAASLAHPSDASVPGTPSEDKADQIGTSRKRCPTCWLGVGCSCASNDLLCTIPVVGGEALAPGLEFPQQLSNFSYTLVIVLWTRG